MVNCYLGLGSNLGNREKNIRLALKYLDSLKDTTIENVSLFYDTDPLGCPPGTPRFLNAAVRIKTSLPPALLLKKLKEIEVNLGRSKSSRFLRPIDLDILFYGQRKLSLPSLQIPHPRIQERAFVLKPLKDVAPGIIKYLARQTKIISSLGQIHNYILQIKSQHKAIGFVPTMGSLHEGHLSLIRQTKKACDVCVVSIFVNPIQFGPQEDYKKYPWDLELDSILAKAAGCDCIFYPQDKDMYPDGYSTYIDNEKLANYLCGLSRPGHFRGVLTVVAKLLNIVRPDIAYFGQKDYQQALIVKKMIQDLNMPLKIRVMPIIRENDGLAMSSRNVYLNAEERLDAAVLYQALVLAENMVLSGQNNSKDVIARIKKLILKKKSARIDYIVVADAQTLEPQTYIKDKIVIALAVWIGKTRLIDNILI